MLRGQFLFFLLGSRVIRDCVRGCSESMLRGAPGSAWEEHVVSGVKTKLNGKV